MSAPATTLETVAAMAAQGAFARMWGRLYAEVLELDEELRPGDVPRMMDRICGEELARLKDPAARPPELTAAIAEAAGVTSSLAGDPPPDPRPPDLCVSCRLPGGHHADHCQSPAARIARGLDPIRPAKRKGSS